MSVQRRGTRVLLADDDALYRRLTERVLHRLGCDVRVVADGQAAVSVAFSESFDLIFMDCQMPMLDGFEATAAIRRREAAIGGPATPIIGLSGRNMAGDAAIALSNGMDDYLTKPATEQRIRAAVAAWAGLTAEGPRHHDRDAVRV